MPGLLPRFRAAAAYASCRISFAMTYRWLSLPAALAHSDQIARWWMDSTDACVPLAEAIADQRNVERWIRRLPRMRSTCLHRAAASSAALRAAGWNATFVVGLAPADSASEQLGHAWVEVEGQRVSDGVWSRFVETFRFPAAEVVAER
jgi:uncharacterized protein YndB with AHSA1/START domain